MDSDRELLKLAAKACFFPACHHNGCAPECIARASKPTVIAGPSSYTVLADLAQAVRDAVARFSGAVPLASAIGVLEIVKHELIEEQSDDL